MFKRWRKHEPAALHADEPEYHLEELALTTVAAEWLTRWQPIAMHRAILAGATPEQLSEAAGLSIRVVFGAAAALGGDSEDYMTVLACSADACSGPLKP